MSNSDAFDAIIFDLDGTLWDTSAACAAAWNQVCERMGIAFREIMAADIASVSGLPHETCIRQIFQGLDEPYLQQLIAETMKEDTAAVRRLGGTLYVGVREGLARLADRLPLYIVSNCQRGYIEAFLAWSGFEGLIRDFECWGNTGLPKADNLADLIRRNGIGSPLYIGDTEGDSTAARSAGAAFIQVTYGFGEPLEDCTQAAQFSEIVDMLS